MHIIEIKMFTGNSRGSTINWKSYVEQTCKRWTISCKILKIAKQRHKHILADEFWLSSYNQICYWKQCTSHSIPPGFSLYFLQKYLEMHFKELKHFLRNIIHMMIFHFEISSHNMKFYHRFCDYKYISIFDKMR